MKAIEFIIENDVNTDTGNVATLTMPMGTIQRRVPLDSFYAKYDIRKKKRKPNARRRS